MSGVYLRSVFGCVRRVYSGVHGVGGEDLRGDQVFEELEDLVRVELDERVSEGSDELGSFWERH